MCMITILIIFSYDYDENIRRETEEDNITYKFMYNTLNNYFYCVYKIQSESIL